MSDRSLKLREACEKGSRGDSDPIGRTGACTEKSDRSARRNLGHVLRGSERLPGRIVRVFDELGSEITCGNGREKVGLSARRGRGVEEKVLSLSW